LTAGICTTASAQSDDGPGDTNPEEALRAGPSTATPGPDSESERRFDSGVQDGEPQYDNEDAQYDTEDAEYDTEDAEYDTIDTERHSEEPCTDIEEEGGAPQVNTKTARNKQPVSRTPRKKSSRKALSGRKVTLGASVSKDSDPASREARAASPKQGPLTEPTTTSMPGPKPSKEQLEQALENAIGAEQLRRMKRGDSFKLHLFPPGSPLEVVWLQAHMIEAIDTGAKRGTYASCVVAARQDPVLWLIAAWRLGVCNVHATLNPLGNTSRRLEPNPDMTATVFGDQVELPWGTLTWRETQGHDNLFTMPDGHSNFEFPWTSLNPLCRAMQGLAHWGHPAVAEAVERLLNPGCTASQVNLIRHRNLSLMTEAAHHSVLYETMCHGYKSHVATALQFAEPGDISDGWKIAVSSVVSDILRERGSLDTTPDPVDPCWRDKVMQLVAPVNNQLPADKRSIDNITSPESNAAKRARIDGVAPFVAW
jgi:hypothetical protein